MSPNRLSRIPVEELAQFVLKCVRDEPALLSRSDFDAIGPAPAQPRRRPIVAAVSFSGVLVATAAIALYGYDRHSGVHLTGIAAGTIDSADMLPRTGLPPVETSALVAGDAPPGSTGDDDVPVATPATPALRTIAIERNESAAATAGYGTRTGELPAADTLRKGTPTTVALPTDALGEVGTLNAPHEAGPIVAAPVEALPQRGLAVASEAAAPAEASRPPDPGVAPDVTARGNAEQADRLSRAMQASMSKPFEATSHRQVEASHPAPGLGPMHSPSLPRQHVIYHTYRQPVRRFVYYRSYYYEPSPAAVLAQFATTVRRSLDAIFH